MHIQHLAGEIGGRGSCSPKERQASEYVRASFEAVNLEQIQVQEFRGSPSAYARYTLVIGVCLVSQLVAAFFQASEYFVASAIIHALSAWAFFAESDFQWNWTHWIVRSQPSQNVLARRTSINPSRRLVVLTAHLDSHRTPFFNSNATWQRIYNLGFRLLFVSLIINAISASLIATTDARLPRFLFFSDTIFLLIGLLAFLHADRTPYSPGAYDNASGVACMMALAGLLMEDPLNVTDCWFVATGCEETGAGGMQALMRAKGDSWREALWINLDQTGIGDLYVRLREGFLHRYGIQPRALSIAEEASRVSGIPLRKRVSQAFSDAAIALQKNQLVISLGASPIDPERETPRHQLTDTPEWIEPGTVQQTLRLVSGILSLWDRMETHHEG